MNQSARLAEFLDRVYSSVADPSGWPYALETLSELFRSTTTGFAYGHRGGGGAISLFVRSDPDWERQYADYYSFRNPFARGESLIREGATLPSELMCPDVELQKTEYYADFLRPRDLRYVLGSFLALRASTASHIVMMRSGRKGPFDEREVRTMERLVPHLQLALEVHRRLSSLRDEAGVVDALRDGRSFAVFAVDRHARVLWTNAAAERIVAEADGLSALRGYMAGAKPHETMALRRMIATACARDHVALAGGRMRLSRPSGRMPYSIVVSPLVATGADPGVARALVLVSLPIEFTHDDFHLIQRVLKVTPQQAHIVLLLAQGHDILAAAGVLRVAPSTVRVHLRIVYRRTGLHSQAQLMSAVMQLVALSPGRTWSPV